MENYCNVYVRDWWRKDSNGRKVPYPGAPRQYLARHVTEADARTIAREYNEAHNPGWRSRKAEFEQA